jgi:hypothetical protein
LSPMALTSDDQWRGAGVVFEAGHLWAALHSRSERNR